MKRRLLVCWALLLFGSLALAGTVPLTVEEPSGVAREQWPVTSGIPLAAGELREAKEATLVTAEGSPLPLQTEVLARWPDGSVRWLLLDFQVDLAAKEKKRFTLRYGPGTVPAPVERPIRVDRGGGDVAIETGPLRVANGVWLDLNRDGQFSAEERLTGDAPGFVLTDAEGRRFTAADPRLTVEVEQAGPIRACLRVSGAHVSEQGRMFRYVARIHVYRGQPWVRICYTFINDYPDALMAKIRSLELVVRPSWQASAGKVLLDGKPGRGGRLFQIDERQYQLDGQPSGKRGCGWAAISGDKAGLAIGLREFWQNWPKSVEAEPAEVRIGICPVLPPGLYDGKSLHGRKQALLRASRRRTHVQGRRGAHPRVLGDLFPRLGRSCEAGPVLPRGRGAACWPRPSRGTSRQLGPWAISPRPIRPMRQSTAATTPGSAAPSMRHLLRREKDREYGMLNFGDWYGERRVNWGNLEYDLPARPFPAVCSHRRPPLLPPRRTGGAAPRRRRRGPQHEQIPQEPVGRAAPDRRHLAPRLQPHGRLL